jgi:2-phospho-L-lactate guanylyltransferase
MALWAIIPVKPFAAGKSRLAGALDAPAREALNRWLFEHVFGTAAAALGAPRVAVVSTDQTLLARVRTQGAHAVREATEGDLNAALADAGRHAVVRGADAILVLPADLPLIAPDDIAALAAAAGGGPACVIAPDRRERGTNALLLAPPDPGFYRFGTMSFAAHIEAARDRGIAVRVVRRPGLAFDLDTPDDYRRLSRRSEFMAMPSAPPR